MFYGLELVGPSGLWALGLIILHYCNALTALWCWSSSTSCNSTGNMSFLFKVSFLTILSLFKGIMGQRKSLLWSIAFPLPIPLDLVHHTTRRTIFLALILTLCRQCWDLSQLERLLHLVIQWQEGQRLEVFMRIYRRFVRFINTEYASFKLFKLFLTPRSRGVQQKISLWDSGFNNNIHFFFTLLP